MNPETKTLRESNLMGLDSEAESMDGLKCDVKKVSMEEDDECLAKMRKIEVSGGNISLVVDFSGSLNGISSSDNVFESNGPCLNENVVKENQTQEFLAGNLVWSMDKSKKWWPGEVVGFRADAKESFEVRYLGQNHLVSWCAPSKLKPFKENFENIVNQRNDKGFLVAVEEAMNLLGNSLKLEMTCSCFAQGNGVISAHKVKTRKTKPLILREYSVDRLEPKEFVSELKNLAKCVLNGGILETTVMQSRLSAFYSFFGHKKIPMSQLHQTEVRKVFTAAKMEDNKFVGSPSVVAGSSRRKFRKEWFRKFVSDVDNVSARDDIVKTSPSDLVAKLKLLAVDHKCSEETENIGLFEWFFSKFRISVFRDETAYKMQLANMAGLKDLVIAKKPNPQKTPKSKKLRKSMMEPISSGSIADTEKKTLESQRSGQSKIELSCGVSVVDTEMKVFTPKKSSVETLNGVSTPDNEQMASKPKESGKTNVEHNTGRSDLSSSAAKEQYARAFQEKLPVQSPQGKASMEASVSRPTAATLVPDLNSGGNAFASSEFDHLQRPGTFIPQEEKTPRTMMLNFQVAAPCSTYGTSGTGSFPSQTASNTNLTSPDPVTSPTMVQMAAPCSNNGISGTGFVSKQTAWERNFTSADLFTGGTNIGKKKRGRKRKNPEALPIVAHTTSGIPDLNGVTTEPASVQPTQRRKYRKKEESPNGLTRGITILFLKFSCQQSMPSRDDLTSRFSAFGPLDSSETHISEETSGAQVAFVSSGDAIEAVKSLEKANPFGETLVSFRLQQKLIRVLKNIAPWMPVISQVSPVPNLNSTPTSVDSMRQNLMMMTTMLEKSGDRLSRETKAKLKSEITGLLEKVSSMPSCSSSS